MTIYSHRYRGAKSAGFTLVELLVVIGIIALLASVILFAGSAALRAAKRTRSSNLANQLQTACQAYYTEYNIYPITTGQTAGSDYLITDASGSASTWAGMLYGLSGNLNPYDGTAAPKPSTYVPNDRGVAFLTMKSSDVDLNNAPINTIPPSPSNPYFNMAVDADNSGVVGDSTSAVNMKLPNFPKSTNTTINMTGTATTGVAIWANCVGNPTTVNPAQWVHTY